MNKQLNTALAALFLATASMTAMATEVGGTYITVGVADISTDTFDGLKVSGITVDDSNKVPTFSVGYQIDKNMSFEAGVVGAIDMTATVSDSSSGTLNGKAYSADGSLTLTGETDTSYILGIKYATPVNDKFNLYGKAGMMFWDTKGVVSAAGTLTYGGTTYSGSTNATFYQNDGSDAYYGAGGSYKVDKVTSINVEYSKLKIDGEDADGLSIAIEFDI